MIYRDQASPTRDELCAAVHRADAAERRQRDIWHMSYDARTVAHGTWNLARGAFTAVAALACIAAIIVMVRGASLVPLASVLACMVPLWLRVGQAYGALEQAQDRCAAEWDKLRQRESDGKLARRALANSFAQSTAPDEREVQP